MSLPIEWSIGRCSSWVASWLNYKY